MAESSPTTLPLPHGLSALLREAAYSQVVTTLASGALLVAFALELGASNAVVGVVAAMPFLAQLMQIAGVALVERLRTRRAIAVTASAVGRTLLLPLALLPLVGRGDGAGLLLALGIALQSGIGAIATCSWNSWVRDLVPQRQMGAFFGRRLFLATIVAIPTGLGAGWLVDAWKASHADAAGAYGLLLALAGVAGLASSICLTRVPDRPLPQMPRQRLSTLFAGPFRDRNFRRLLAFSGCWQFAVNLATPFFVVYMVQELHYGLSTVMVLTVTGQLANLAMLRRWGWLADRFGNKAVIGLCAPGYLLCVLGWIFVANPEPHPATLPLLFALHVGMGLTSAGTTLAAGNIGLTIAPRGLATPYLAAGSLVMSAAAALAPILGGLLADDLAARQLSLMIHWEAPTGGLQLVSLHLRHWEFFFLAAAAAGAYALHRLGKVNEPGAQEAGLVARLLLRAMRAAWGRRPARRPARVTLAGAPSPRP